MIAERLVRVDSGVRAPMISTDEGSRPTSSSASRRAAPEGPSPASNRPPGKATSPVCERSRRERRVSTTWAWPPSSKRAHRTAAGLGSVPGRSGGSEGGTGGAPTAGSPRAGAGGSPTAGSPRAGTGGAAGDPGRRAKATRTSARLMRPGTAAPGRAHHGGGAGRAPAGRGIRCGPPRRGPPPPGPERAAPVPAASPPAGAAAGGRLRSDNRGPDLRVGRLGGRGGGGGGGGGRDRPGGELLEQDAQAGGLEGAHDPPGGGLAALPLHPDVEQLGGVGGRSIHGPRLRPGASDPGPQARVVATL